MLKHWDNCSLVLHHQDTIPNLHVLIIFIFPSQVPNALFSVPENTHAANNISSGLCVSLGYLQCFSTGDTPDSHSSHLYYIQLPSLILVYFSFAGGQWSVKAPEQIHATGEWDWTLQSTLHWRHITATGGKSFYPHKPIHITSPGTHMWVFVGNDITSGTKNRHGPLL